MEVKCNLKHILIDKKMDQSELAKLTGLTRTTISLIANGKSLNIVTALKIAKALGVSVEEIWELVVQ